MAKYCCFTCPALDEAEKSLDDECPTCGRPYGFPLENYPSAIGSYKILRTLGRGFYAATYVAERGALKARVVLKVSPKQFYEFFPNKDFERECQLHAEVSQGAQHIVGIRDMSSADVFFGEVNIPCHIAELEFVDGRLLADYISIRQLIILLRLLHRLRLTFFGSGMNFGTKVLTTTICMRRILLSRR